MMTGTNNEDMIVCSMCGKHVFSGDLIDATDGGGNKWICFSYALNVTSQYNNDVQIALPEELNFCCDKCAQEFFFTAIYDFFLTRKEDLTQRSLE